MSVFMCKYCGSMIEKSSSPSSAGCPAHGNHVWFRLCSKGSVQPGNGLHPFSCKYCGKIVYCSSSPSSAGCPAHGNHVWFRS